MERKYNRTKKTKTPYFGNPDIKPAKKHWKRLNGDRRIPQRCVDWNANGMYLKFSQHPELKEKLLTTGNEDLLEANP